MFRRLLILAVLGVTLSGCYMLPMALVGPAASGFTTASIVQSGLSTTANYMIKKSTGKTIAQHALNAVGGDKVLKQTYFPENDKLKHKH